MLSKINNIKTKLHNIVCIEFHSYKTSFEMYTDVVYKLHSNIVELFIRKTF